MHEKAGAKINRMHAAQLGKAENAENLSEENPEQGKILQDLGIHSLGLPTWPSRDMNICTPKDSSRASNADKTDKICL